MDAMESFDVVVSIPSDDHALLFASKDGRTFLMAGGFGPDARVWHDASEMLAGWSFVEFRGPGTATWAREAAEKMATRAGAALRLGFMAPDGTIERITPEADSEPTKH